MIPRVQYYQRKLCYPDWPLPSRFVFHNQLITTNLPEDFNDMVGIIELADHREGNEVLRIISDQPQLPRHKLTNLKRTHKLKQLLRGAYRVSKDWAHKAGALGDAGCVTSDLPLAILLLWVPLSPWMQPKALFLCKVPQTSWSAPMCIQPSATFNPHEQLLRDLCYSIKNEVTM